MSTSGLIILSPLYIWLALTRHDSQLVDAVLLGVEVLMFIHWVTWGSKERLTTRILVVSRSASRVTRLSMSFRPLTRVLAPGSPLLLWRFRVVRQRPLRYLMFHVANR